MAFILGSGFVDISVKSDTAIKQLDNVSKALTKVENSMEGIAKTAKRFLVFQSGIIAGGIAALQSQEDAEARLNTVLRSTGFAAGRSVEEIKKQAKELEKLTGIADQSIISTQAFIATFTEIRGEQFDLATKAAIGLSEVMKGSLKQSAIQLGKALQDPERGLSALRRVGVAFSNQQRDLIRLLFETGRVAEGQNLLFKIIAEQGIQLILNKDRPLTMALRNWKLGLLNVGEAIGSAFAPGLISATNAIAPMVNRLAEWIELHPELITGLFKVTAAVTGVTVAVVGFTTAINVLTTVGIIGLLTVLGLVIFRFVQMGIELIKMQEGFQAAKAASSEFKDAFLANVEVMLFALENLTFFIEEIPALIEGITTQLAKIGGTLTAAFGELIGSDFLQEVGEEVVSDAEERMDKLTDELGNRLAAFQKRVAKERADAAKKDAALPAPPPRISFGKQEAQAQQNVFQGLQQAFFNLSQSKTEDKQLKQLEEINKGVEKLNKWQEKQAMQAKQGAQFAK